MRLPKKLCLISNLMQLFVRVLWQQHVTSLLPLQPPFPAMPAQAVAGRALQYVGSFDWQNKLSKCIYLRKNTEQSKNKIKEQFFLSQRCT